MRLATLALLAACSTAAEAPPPWLTDEAAAFAQARRDHEAVVIDFTATWSVPSVELSRLLDTPAIRTALAPDFVALRLDVSNQDARVDELRARYGTATLPALVFVDRDGVVLSRISSRLNDQELRAAIASAAAKRAH